MSSLPFRVMSAIPSSPEDVAGAVRFFVSEGSSYVTGERLYVHGGGS